MTVTRRGQGVCTHSVVCVVVRATQPWRPFSSSCDAAASGAATATARMGVDQAAALSSARRWRSGLGLGDGKEAPDGVCWPFGWGCARRGSRDRCAGSAGSK
ncbi:hypothetical protein ACFPRL_23225 [Pseudoclavibacter helvolus]